MGFKVLHNISYGVYVVSSKKGGDYNGCVMNSVIQTSAEPPTISICINRENLTYEYIRNSGVFTISILSQNVGLPFIGHFGFRSGKDFNKFAELDYKISEKTGAPVLMENSLGYIEAEVRDSMDVETHTIFAGNILYGENFNIEEKPLTYAHYHQVKKGKTPEKAPSYIKND
ncbi:MAG: flavin reductase family protein [Halanaerobiales bacterium]